MRVEFGAWTPDRDDQSDAGLTVARNVVPSEGRYRPFPRFVPTGLRGGGLAAKAGHAPGDGPRIFSASASEIYRDGVSIADGLSSTAWDFAQWGGEMLAASPEEGLHHAGIASGRMARESAAPPARLIARFGDFVMLGNVDGSPSRIHWSGINDRSAWDPDPVTQAGFQDLPVEHGAVTGLAWGEYPTVFQERAISRIAQVGPPLTFAIDTLPVEKGCIAPGSLAQVAGATFFIAQDGPNIWNGQGARPIGEGRFRRWWREHVTPAQAATARTAVDWEQGVILWQWNGGGLVYSWAEDRAAEFAPGEDFPVMLGAPLSVDHAADGERPSWGDGLASAAAVDGGGRFGTFSGEPYEGVMETGEIAPAADRRAYVSEVWPDVDAASAFIALGSRSRRQSDALTYGPEATVNAHGMAPVRSDARWHRVRLRIPAGERWTHAKGVEVTARATGRL